MAMMKMIVSLYCCLNNGHVMKALWCSLPLCTSRYYRDRERRKKMLSMCQNPLHSVHPQPNIQRLLLPSNICREGRVRKVAFALQFLMPHAYHGTATLSRNRSVCVIFVAHDDVRFLFVRQENRNEFAAGNFVRGAPRQKNKLKD